MSITRHEKIDGNPDQAEERIFEELHGKRFFAITENLEYTSDDPDKCMYTVLAKQYDIEEVIHVMQTLLANIAPQETL